MTFTIVSWYTPDYALCNERLVESLKANGYENYIMYPQVPVGRWTANVRYYKPRILAQALKELDGDVLYLDSDAIVQSRMELFDNWTGEDIGVHYRAEQELLGGTVYLRPSARLILALDEIANVMEAANLVWQQAAQLTIPRHPELSVKRLPPEYCCIWDSMRKQHPGIVPVVEHMQFSRQVQH